MSEATEDNPEVYYFGSGAPHHSQGHFWYKTPGLTNMLERHAPFPADIDGRHTPTHTNREGAATITRRRDSTGGDWTIMAWWDYTGDARGGSNSNIVARGEHDFPAMVGYLHRYFPEIASRQRQPLTRA